MSLMPSVSYLKLLSPLAHVIDNDDYKFLSSAGIIYYESCVLV